jgi:hypothetical protein
MKIDLLIFGTCATPLCPNEYRLKVEGVHGTAFQSLPVGSFAIQGSKLLEQKDWRATDNVDEWLCPGCFNQTEAEARKRFIDPTAN